MKIPYNTTYFSEDDVRLAVNGCCHDFALAMHRRTGWRIGTLWIEPIIDQYTIIDYPVPAHVFVYTPAGQPIDAEGVSDMESIKAKFGREGREITISDFVSEADYAQKIAEHPSSSVADLVPKEHRIEGAEKVIAKSPAFLALVASLQAPSS